MVRVLPFAIVMLIPQTKRFFSQNYFVIDIVYSGNKTPF